MSYVSRAVSSDKYRWDDMQIQLGAIKLPGTSDPAWEPYKGGYVLAFAHNADNIVNFTCQLTHKRVTGADMDFHLHVAYPDGNAGNSRWHLTHSWADIGSDFPAETTISDTFASPENQDNHTYHEFSTLLTGSGIVGVSSMLICSLQREGTDAVNDTYGNSIYLISADFHIKVDEIGSQSELSK